MRIVSRRSLIQSVSVCFLLCAPLLALSACSDDTNGTPTTPSVSVVQLAVSPSRLLLNGSFEEGPALPVYDLVIEAGSSDIAGWTVTRGEIKYLGGPWDVSDGARAIDLDGNAPGEISQTFATSKNQTYVVWFDLSGNPEGAVVKHVRATVDGFTADYSFNTSGQTKYALTWQPISFTFVASGTSATLSFMSLSSAGSAHGALIDNVSIVQPQ
jgi:choice-of-anchor C domain-containing protein